MLLLYACAPLNAAHFSESWRLFLFMGLPSVVMGLGLRLWSRGYDRDSGLVLDGAYRYVRNPVELGAILVFAGAAVVLGVKWWFNAVSLVLAIAYMSLISVSYERVLYLKMGGIYLRYAQRVRRWLPSRFPATNRSNLAYSLGRAIREERDGLVWLVGYAVVYAFRRRVGF